jgi:DNA-binding NarL/FixJ family response regulator
MTFTLPSTPCHGRAAHRPIRTVIVDDHTLVRAGLRRLIQDADSIEVVGEARDANEALAMVESHRPDLVLMDIAMPPGVNGLEATARIKARFPDTRVIVLSMHSSAEYALQALRAGASGYLLKNSAPGEIGVAIRAVMNGGLYF